MKYILTGKVAPQTEMKSYDRLPAETESQWLAFKYYRDLGEGRTLVAAMVEYREIKGSKGTGNARQFSEWRLTHNWDIRVRDYDRDQEEIDRQRLEDAIGKELTEGIDKYRKNVINSAAIDLHNATLTRTVVLSELVELSKLPTPMSLADCRRFKLVVESALLATKISDSYATQTEKAYHVRLLLDQMVDKQDN